VGPWVADVGTDVTELGCEWEIESGTWDIEGIGYPFYNSRMACTENANALIQSKIDQSEFNCSEYTDFGYHSFLMYINFDTVGDTARIYIDWDGFDGHYVEFTARGYVDGIMSDGSVAFYKGDTLLETYSIGPNAGGDLLVLVKTALATDGSGFSILYADWPNPIPYYIYDSSTYWGGRGLTITTVYGHKRVAFGTGATVNGKVSFFNPIVRANINDCNVAYIGECSNCPSSDSVDFVTRGFYISITGITSAYGSPCNCSLVEGTYDVPPGSDAYIVDGEIQSVPYSTSLCSANGMWTFCHISSPFDYDINKHIMWRIVKTGTGWQFQVDIVLAVYIGVVDGARYKKDFAWTDSCEDMLEYQELECDFLYGENFPCTNWVSALVTVTKH
jgi:hypothetical protein